MLRNGRTIVSLQNVRLDLVRKMRPDKVDALRLVNVAGGNLIGRLSCWSVRRPAFLRDVFAGTRRVRCFDRRCPVPRRGSSANALAAYG